MLRALLIYAATVTAAIVAGTVALGVPLEWVAWTVLLAEAVPLATWAGAMLIRRTMRQTRQDWSRLTCDPVDRLPVTRVTAELVAPQQRQIEAPRRELTK